MDTTTNSAAYYRELGEARLKLSTELKTMKEWQERWPEPKHGFPFEFGTCWTQCTTYGVEDYAAEVGFFHDVLGLPANAFSPGFAMFTSPDKAFYFAVVPVGPEMKATPGDALDIGFMVNDLPKLSAELESRGVAFEDPVAPLEGTPMLKAGLRTPNGIRITLWSMPEVSPQD